MEIGNNALMEVCSILISALKTYVIILGSATGTAIRKSLSPYRCHDCGPPGQDSLKAISYPPCAYPIKGLSNLSVNKEYREYSLGK